MSAARLHRLACACVVLATLATFAVAASPIGHRAARYLAVHGMLTLAMLIAWRSTDPRDVRWLLGTGCIARLALLAMPPFTTRDVTRYLWDGHLALLGLDPYVITPLDPIVAGARAAWLPSGAHLDLPTLYPPGAVALFSAAALAGPVAGPWVWKAMVTGASLVTLFATRTLLRARGLERHLALVALSPLALLESGVGAHLDAVATAALVVALRMFDARREATSGVMLGAGALLKFVPGLATLPIAIASRRPLRVVAAALGGAVAGYVASLGLGWRPVGSLAAPLRSWRFGSPLWAGLEHLLGSAHVPMLAAALGMLAVSAVVARTGRLAAAIQLAIAAPLIASPVVHPWYLLPLVPVVALAPSATALAWLSAAPLTYEVIDRADALGLWQPLAWPLWAIAAAVGIGGLVDGLRYLRAGPPVSRAPADVEPSR